MIRFLFLSSLWLIFSCLATAQIDSIFSQVTGGAVSVFSDATSVGASLGSVVTSGAGSLATVITSGAGNVFETVTSVGGSVVTVVTSAGGRGVTLGASGATGVVGDLTSFYQSATAAAHSNAASQLGVLGGISIPLLASLASLLFGIFIGARTVL